MSWEMPSRIQRFEVAGELGAGGMGTVYRARDPLLARDVAIKVLSDPGRSTELSPDTTIDLRSGAPTSTDDLLREARMMAQLSHPNVLPVHEVGLCDGRMFVVMEHIDGCDLAAWLESPRTIPEILDTFTQAARGLAAAHDRGIVHRDFKPANVLVGVDGRVRVADFGLSQLTAGVGMVRVDDGGGTPHYMAPELWKSGAATAAADVYAFCVALGDAVGADNMTPALRDAVTAGLADDPAARPDMHAILRTLSGRTRPRWITPLVLALGLAGLVGIALAIRARTGPSCSSDSPLGAGWSARHHTALAFALDPSTPERRAMTDRIIDSFDRDLHALDDRWISTCEAARESSLTEQQAAVQRSCLERRGFELTAKVEAMIAKHPPDLGTLLERASLAEAADCIEVTAPPIRDRAAALDLYRRSAATDYLPTGTARIPPLQAIVEQALAADEQELAARSLISIGLYQTNAGLLKEGDATLERAYRMEVDLHNPRLQATALMQRSENATMRADSHEATSFANVALGLVESPDVSPATRARVYAQLGRAELTRGQSESALKWLDKGLEMVAKDGHRAPLREWNLLSDKTRVMANLEGHREDAVAAGRALVEFSRTNFGDKSLSYAKALSTLGANLEYAGDAPGGLASRQQGVALAEKLLGPDDQLLLGMRADLAIGLEAAGRMEDARKILAAEAEMLETHQVLAAQRSLIMYHLGYTTAGVGRLDEGMAMIERAIELGVAQYGANSQQVQMFRSELLNLQLDFKRLDDAEKTIARLDEAYHAPGDHTRSLLGLDGVFRARLAIARHDPHKAELLTRKALAAWAEIHGDRVTQADLQIMLADELLEEKKWVEGARELDKAVELATSLGYTDKQLAQLEINRQTALRGLKKPMELEKLRAARAALANDPIYAPTVKEADELLRRR